MGVRSLTKRTVGRFQQRRAVGKATLEAARGALPEGAKLGLLGRARIKRSARAAQHRNQIKKVWKATSTIRKAKRKAVREARESAWMAEGGGEAAPEATAGEGE